MDPQKEPKETVTGKKKPLFNQNKDCYPIIGNRKIKSISAYCKRRKT
jgi:hypothetical protein